MNVVATITGARFREYAIAAVAVTVAWWVATTVFPLSSLGDIAVYARTYRLMEQGALPYRDFSLEYPPLAAALFWLCGALPGSYATTFGLLMLVCHVLTALGALSTARALQLGPAQRAVTVVLVALTPLLIGTELVAARYDAAVAAVLAWVAALAVRGRWTTMWALVAVGILLKLTPVLVGPALLVLQAAQHRRPGPGATAAATVRAGLPGWSVAAAIMFVGLVPALALSAEGTVRVLAYHEQRPLQIESVAASALLIDHTLRGTDLVQVRSYGSDNLDGPVAGALQQGGSLLAVIGVLAIAALLAVRLWRSPAPPRPPGTVLGAEPAVVALAATLAVAVVTGKVLSPQYLLWLVPLVPLVRGWRGPTAAALLAVAMVLSRIVFPSSYIALVEDLQDVPIVLLATRNALLIAIAVLLVHALAVWRPRSRDPRPMTDVPHALP